MPFASGSSPGSSAPSSLYKFDGTNWTRHGAVRPHVDHNLADPSHRHGMACHGTIRPSASDMGANWVRIDGDAHRYGGVSRIGADTSNYGRVFMPGRGLDYNY